MNDALAEGNAFNVTEQSVKAMEAAYDVICLEPPTTRPPTTEPPTTQPPTTKPPTTQPPTSQTTGSGEQDRINNFTLRVLRRYKIFAQSKGAL